jgi:acyl transferase domain-containing protein
VDEFWRNLKDGRDCITGSLTPSCWPLARRPSVSATLRYVKAAGLLPDVADFDAEFFGMSPQDARCATRSYG